LGWSPGPVGILTFVLSVDEKSQIQALDRTQPGLPMKRGRAGTMTHDYKRNGSTTPFAALNVLDGTVVGRNIEEFIRFRNTIEAQVPKRKAIMPLSTTVSPENPKVSQWLARYPLWTLHFTPTSASGSCRGRLLRQAQHARLKRGVFQSLSDLQAAINRFLVETNEIPNHSSRPQIPPRFWPLSNEGSKRYSRSTSTVAVGTRIAPRLPHRSRRALLTHRAPLSGFGVEAMKRQRV
jgi:hypothetical protein